MLALIDYGAGNLTSVRKALGAIDAPFFTPSSPVELRGVEGIIVPGVGHFAATRALDGPWRAVILEGVTSGIPLLGICLGLQYLFEGSEEAPDVAGLGLLAGSCGLLPPTLKVPHVGWNSLDFAARLPHSRRSDRRHAGLFHALVRSTRDRRVRGHRDT